MKKTFSAVIKKFFGKDMDMRIKIFHLLAVTGVIICVAMAIVSAAGGRTVSLIVNAGAGIFSFFLLIYSERTKNYKFCYLATVICIFFFLFTFLFTSGGGYKGGMPFFFVFAVGFTVYMIEGKEMLITVSAEIIYYILLCVYAFLFPEKITPFGSEEAVLTDVIIGLFTVSTALGATMFVQVRMYKKQQRELKEAIREAEEANSAKSVFLANMSHEIRTPLHMILGMNEVISRENKNPAISQYSEKIDESGKMLLSLVNSVLDVAKIESGKTEIKNAPYSVKELIKILALIGKTHCDKKNLEFIMNISDTLPPVLCGDIPHIKQIASNLLSNAAKYTEKGSVELNIYDRKTDDGIILGIEVKDTGIGIKSEELPSVFEIFTRSSSTENSSVEGSGLGLSIVKNLTELMKGQVKAESVFGEGSTFTVEIPQKTGRETSLRETGIKKNFRAPSARILVTDDNEGNIMLFRSMIKDTGIITDSAMSGRECIEKTEKNSYDLIFMDYMMPGMNGEEALRELKKNKEFRTPVIALTADAAKETEKKLLDAGFEAYLSKPVSADRIKSTLLSFLPEEKTQESSVIKRTGAEADTEKYRKQLEEYGINLAGGMKYFDNSFEEYSGFAGIIRKYAAADIEKLKAALKGEQPENLVFTVHSLKGKAENLGADRLYESSAEAERLCRSGNYPEVLSLLPYVIYLYENAVRGLSVLPGEEEEDIVPSPPEDISLLPSYIDNMRRKPALLCLEAIYRNENSEEGRIILRETKEQVNLCDFDGAKKSYGRYKAMKAGEQNEK